MTTDTPTNRLSSIDRLLQHYVKIENLIDSHNYRNAGELADAAGVIRWMFGLETLDSTPSFAVLCRNLQHRPANVRKEFFATRANRWTVENIADLTERIGEPVMASVLAARDVDAL